MSGATSGRPDGKTGEWDKPSNESPSGRLRYLDDDDGGVPTSREFSKKLRYFDDEGGDVADPKGAARVIGETAVGTTAETAFMMPLTLGGIKYGGKLGGTPGAIAGGIAGFATSMWGGDKMRKMAVDAGLTYGDVSELHPSERLLGRGTEAVVSALSGGSAFAFMGKSGFKMTGKTIAGKFTNETLDYAKHNGWRFLKNEIMMGTTGATGAVIADYMGGNEATIAATEMIAGSFIKPGQWAMWAGNKIKEHVLPQGMKNVIDKAGDSLSRVTQNQKEFYAGNLMRRGMEAAGEDVSLALDLMRTADPNITTNAADATGSPFLGAIQIFLAKESEEFGAKASQQYKDSMEVLYASIGALKKTGHPEALAQAAKLEQEVARGTLHQLAQNAQLRAGELAERMVGTGAKKSDIGHAMRPILHESMKMARKHQTYLWEHTPQDTPALFSNFRDSLATAIQDVSSARVTAVIPPWVMTQLQHFEEEAYITVAHLTKLRSDLLDAARVADKAGERNSARLLGDMAEAVVEDLSSIPSLANDTTYQAAVAYSKDFNDVFYRSFVGKALDNAKYGKRIPPELLVNEITAGPAEAMAMRMADIDEATHFMVTHGYPETYSDLETIRAAEAQILQDLTRRFYPIVDGKPKIDVDGLDNFMRDPDMGGLVEERFPDLHERITRTIAAGRDEATTAENLKIGMTMVGLDEASVHARRNGTDTIEETARLFDGMVSGNPKAVVLAVINSDQPHLAIKPLLDLVNKADTPLAKAGLKVTLLDTIMTKATKPGDDGFLDFDMFEKMLFGKVGDWSEPLMPMLMDAGVFDQKDVDHIVTYLEYAKRMRAARDPNMMVDEIDEGPGMVMDTAIRMVGITTASVLTKTLGRGGGHELFVMGAASRGARELFTNMPNEKIKRIIMQAMLDKDYMAEIMTKVETAEDLVRRERRIYSFLLHNGYLPIDKFVELTSDDQYEETYPKPTPFK